MTFDALKQNIRTWVAFFLNTEVIFSHGNGPRPNGQYAILNVVNINKLGDDDRSETRQVGGEIQADYTGIRKVMVSINIYRGDTQEQMLKLTSSLSKIFTQDYFNNLNIGIIEPSDIRHIPEVIGKSWEDRTQCDFFFYYNPDIENDLDISEIKQIEITNEINGEDITIT